MMDTDLLVWLTGDGDILLMTARTLFLCFALQFITGVSWILRGGADVSK